MWRGFGELMGLAGELIRGWEMEAPVGIEPTIAELQSTALPLCYGALNFLFTTYCSTTFLA